MGRFSRIAKDNSGAAAIEYGLLAALISIAIIGALTNLGDTVSMAFGNFAAMLNDSYGVHITDATGTFDDNGMEYSYNDVTITNANGSQSFDDVSTDANGNVWDTTGTITYQGAIGGQYWSESGTQTYNGQFSDSFSETNTDPGDGSQSYTDAAGQTQTDSYSTTSNANGYTTTYTGTNFDGQAFTTSETVTNSQGTTTTTTDNE